MKLCRIFDICMCRKKWTKKNTSAHAGVLISNGQCSLRRAYRPLPLPELLPPPEVPVPLVPVLPPLLPEPMEPLLPLLPEPIDPLLPLDPLVPLLPLEPLPLMPLEPLLPEPLPLEPPVPLLPLEPPLDPPELPPLPLMPELPLLLLPLPLMPELPLPLLPLVPLLPDEELCFFDFFEDLPELLLLPLPLPVSWPLAWVPLELLWVLDPEDCACATGAPAIAANTEAPITAFNKLFIVDLLKGWIAVGAVTVAPIFSAL